MENIVVEIMNNYGYLGIGLLILIKIYFHLYLVNLY